MVATFLEIHHHIQQRYTLAATLGAKGLKVFGQDVFVVLPREEIRQMERK